jgi:hypothetical protein
MSRQPTGTRNTRPFRHESATGVFACLLLLTVPAPAAPAAAGNLDPTFARLPFNEWLSQGKQSQIRWSVEVLPAELSTHQRLILRVAIRVDGREIEKRRGPGDITALLQFEDSEGRVWQNHNALKPADMHTSTQSREITFLQYAFVLPGDYTLSIALCDTATLEHSVTLRKVHIAPLKSDPLPESWAALPAVEFIPGINEPPDVWYLPAIGNRLRLPVKTRRPVHVQIVVNTTPTQRAAGSLTTLRNNMSVLIPALKVLSQIDLANGSIDAALLDLTHRRVTFEQKNVDRLNWDGMRKFFIDTKPGVIDVRELAGQWKMRRFFWEEISRRLGGVQKQGNDGARNVVIVLSGPAFFDDQEPVEPLELPNDPDRRLFYIRYRTVPLRMQRPRMKQGARGPALAPSAVFPMGVDDLEHTVEPLNARLFDATSSEQFRRIVAAVIDQLSHM